MKLIDEELVKMLLYMISDYSEELAENWQVAVIINDLKTLEDAPCA